MRRQRSEQKGKLGKSSSFSTSNPRPQIGQRPRIIQEVPLLDDFDSEVVAGAGAGAEEVEGADASDDALAGSLGLSAFAPFLYDSLR
jgi:hypothetical protein